MRLVFLFCLVLLAVAAPFVSAAHFEPTRSWSMVRGTHRPEILIDGKDVYLVVVEHVGKVRHRAYRYRYPNLDRPVISFDVSRTTERYGLPADHRAVIVNGELIVVYQSNVMKGDASLHRRQGPAEDRAQSQSLLLARFTLGASRFCAGQSSTVRPLAARQRTRFSQRDAPRATSRLTVYALRSSTM